jgi:hypothetical protein
VLVADLARRGIAVLLHDYVTEHAAYGWATTIDAAQGATTDTGIVLIRPGMDREHLYVGMTRGRHGNHAYLAADPTHHDDHHAPGPTARSGPDEIVRDTFGAALATSGAQDAAHTARARAGELAAQAAERARQAAEARAAAEKENRREAARAAALQPTPEHAATIDLLQQRTTERAGLERDHDHHLQVLARARKEFADLPRFAPRRRPALSELIHQHETARQQLQPPLARLHGEIKELTRQVETDTRTRQQTADRIDREDTYRDLANNLTRGRGGDLAKPLPVETVAAIGSRRARDQERIRRSRDQNRTREHSRGRDRDDRGIGI